MLAGGGGGGRGRKGEGREAYSHTRDGWSRPGTYGHLISKEPGDFVLVKPAPYRQHVRRNHLRHPWSTRRKGMDGFSNGLELSHFEPVDFVLAARKRMCSEQLLYCYWCLCLSLCLCQCPCLFMSRAHACTTYVSVCAYFSTLVFCYLFVCCTPYIIQHWWQTDCTRSSRLRFAGDLQVSAVKVAQDHVFKAPPFKMTLRLPPVGRRNLLGWLRLCWLKIH